MGLDGISINQLRVTPENNSSELNAQARFGLNENARIVDGLSEGQKVDPDKEHEKEQANLNKKFTSSEQEQEDEISEEPVEKYDLSHSDKYVLKLDEVENTILIVEKTTKKIIQRIDAEELSQFVNYMSGPTGSIINRKF